MSAMELTLGTDHDNCDEPCDGVSRVDAAREKLLPSDMLSDVSAIFRVLGDPMRLQIIHLLSAHELCVCDLTELLDAGQSTVSNHLRVLRAHKVVRTRKKGKLVFYALSSSHLAALVATSVEPAAHRKVALQ